MVASFSHDANACMAGNGNWCQCVLWPARHACLSLRVLMFHASLFSVLSMHGSFIFYDMFLPKFAIIGLPIGDLAAVKAGHAAFRRPGTLGTL